MGQRPTVGTAELYMPHAEGTKAWSRILSLSDAFYFLHPYFFAVGALRLHAAFMRCPEVGMMVGPIPFESFHDVFLVATWLSRRFLVQ